MDERSYDTLEKALGELESGAALETTLLAYPELQPELEAIQIARSIAQVDVPSGVVSRSRTQILARAMQLRQDAPPRRGLFNRFPRFALTLIVVAFFLLSGSGLVAASAQAIPGDQLYPVKRSFERVRLGLAISPENHRQIEEQFHTRRLDEVERLLALGRIEMVQFYGNVDQQGAGFWVISGIKVDLTPTTIILGEILPGMTVEVEGITQPQGWVQASEIHLQIFTFSGYMESITADVWRIAGRDVKIVPDSQIVSDIQVGDWVMATVQLDDFGSLTARTIKLASLPTPTSTPTLMPDSPLSPDDDQEEVENQTRNNDEDEDRQGESTESPEIEYTHESDESDKPEKTKKPDKTDESDDHDDESDDD